MPSDKADRLAIRELIENWALWRDARMWDRFRTVWHKDGQMWATWFQGSHEEFIRVSLRKVMIAACVSCTCSAA